MGHSSESHSLRQTFFHSTVVSLLLLRVIAATETVPGNLHHALTSNLHRQPFFSQNIISQKTAFKANNLDQWWSHSLDHSSLSQYPHQISLSLTATKPTVLIGVKTSTSVPAVEFCVPQTSWHQRPVTAGEDVTTAECPSPL